VGPLALQWWHALRTNETRTTIVTRPAYNVRLPLHIPRRACCPGPLQLPRAWCLLIVCTKFVAMVPVVGSSSLYCNLSRRVEHHIASHPGDLLAWNTRVE
jgi:hypothetical protein